MNQFRTEIGERKSISACLSSLSSWSWSSSMPWWGLTPPRGQAPVDMIHVHISALKRAPGIPRRRNERGLPRLGGLRFKIEASNYAADVRTST